MSATIIDVQDLSPLALEQIENYFISPDRVAIVSGHEAPVEAYVWLYSPSFESAEGRRLYKLANGDTLLLPAYNETENGLNAKAVNNVSLTHTLFSPRRNDPLYALDNDYAKQLLEQDKAVQVWLYDDAPQEYKEVVKNQPMEYIKWLAHVPNQYRRPLPYLRPGTDFTFTTLKVKVNSGHIHLGGY